METYWFVLQGGVVWCRWAWQVAWEESVDYIYLYQFSPLTLVVETVTRKITSNMEASLC